MTGWKTDDGPSITAMSHGGSAERSIDGSFGSHSDPGHAGGPGGGSLSHTAGNRPKGGTRKDDADLLGEFSLDDEVGFLVRRVHQRVTALFQERMRDHDLTPTQFSSLCKMAETGEVSQNQLGRLVNLDPATNQGVVRRLQKRGLIQRRDDPNDRRRSLLTLTDQGREVLVACMPAASRITPSVLKPLNSEERALLMDMLRRLG